MKVQSGQIWYYYKVEINNSKNSFIRNEIENVNDQVTMWKNIKNYVLNKKTSEIQKVHFENEKN